MTMTTDRLTEEGFRSVEGARPRHRRQAPRSRCWTFLTKSIDCISQRLRARVASPTVFAQLPAHDVVNHDPDESSGERSGPQELGDQARVVGPFANFRRRPQGQGGVLAAPGQDHAWMVSFHFAVQGRSRIRACAACAALHQGRHGRDCPSPFPAIPGAVRAGIRLRSHALTQAAQTCWTHELEETLERLDRRLGPRPRD